MNSIQFYTNLSVISLLFFCRTAVHIMLQNVDKRSHRANPWWCLPNEFYYSHSLWLWLWTLDKSANHIREIQSTFSGIFNDYKYTGTLYFKCLNFTGKHVNPNWFCLHTYKYFAYISVCVCVCVCIATTQHTNAHLYACEIAHLHNWICCCIFVNRVSALTLKCERTNGNSAKNIQWKLYAEQYFNKRWSYTVAYINTLQ